MILDNEGHIFMPKNKKMKEKIMNQVYLSGRIGPIVIQSKENEILHVTSVLTVMHTTASGIRKEE